VIAVRDRIAEFGEARVVVVTFTAPDHLAAYREHLGLSFDVVTDVERQLYSLLGAERGTSRQVWSAGTLRMYARLLWQGRRLRRPTEDIRQLGADAVVDAAGTLVYLSLPTSPDARPPVQELIDASR
jgi:hypothetical protein